MATLRLVPPSGAPLEITKDQVLIGRDPSCDVVIADGSVSRKHARLERRGEVWAVVDQASANGTYVDSQRVADAGLRHGQELRFGAVTYRVEIEGAGPSDRTIAAPISAATVVQPVPLAPPPPPPAPLPPPPLPRAGAAPPPPRPPSGAPVRPAPPRPGMGSPVPPMPAAPPPGKGKGPAFWIATGCCGCLLLVLLAIGAVAFFGYFATQEPVAASRAQLAEIKAGQMDAAYARFSEEFRRRITQADFEAFVARTPALKQSTDSTFLSRSLDGNRARLSGVLATPQGSTEVAYELAKEAGGWRISAIKVEGKQPVHEASNETAPTGGALEVRTAQLQKTPAGEGTSVTIKIQVSGFAVRPEGDAYRIDLAGDLETSAPGGERVASLSKANFHRLREATSSPAGNTASFTTELTLHAGSPKGTYTVKHTVRDLVGGGRKVHVVSFELP